MPLTLAEVLDSRIPVRLSQCGYEADGTTPNPKVVQWLNEARQQLMNRTIGGWFGQTVRAKFCMDNGCVVWPREVGSVVALAVNRQPIHINNQFWEFIENLNHIEDCDPGCCACGCNTGWRGWNCDGPMHMNDDNTMVPVHRATKITGSTIRVYPSDAADVGKTMIFQGYDFNNIWVRTTVGGTVIDGEQVTLALPYVDTVTTWYPGMPTGVTRQRTAHRVLVYEHDVVGDGDIPMSTYQPDETRPAYRRSIIPGLRRLVRTTACNTSGDPCCTGDGCGVNPSVMAIVKLAYAPVSELNDWVYPANPIALEYATLSRKRDEENDIEGSEAALKQAIRELRHELDAMTGNRQEIYVNINRSARFSRISAGMY